jgi:hypothetical protein
MIGRLSAACAGLGKSGTWRLVAVPAAAAIVLLGATVTASAATASYHSPDGGLALRTLVRHVHIRTGPSLSDPIEGHLGKAGSKIVVNCYARGSRVAGNPIWYHLVRPREGYITSYYVRTHTDPVQGLLACGAHPAFSRAYRTLVTGMRIRELPSRTARAVTKLGGVGSPVVVNCFTYGQRIRGDRVWYHTVAPVLAYIAGRHLNTGHDPAHGVPRCR